MGFVYLIYDRNNNSYKIGVTKGDPKTRLKKLQTGNTCELEIVNLFQYEYPYRLESMLHNHYKQYNEMNEWFGLSNPAEFLDKCLEFSNIIDSMLDNPFFKKNLR